jgi:hypothetical protein
MLEPADRAMFYCNFKQPDADGREGEEISVAYYFEHLANPRKRLDYPWLPGHWEYAAAARNDKSALSPVEL